MDVKRVVGAGLAVIAIQAATLLAILAVIEPLIVVVFGSSFHGAVPYAKVLLTAQALGGVAYVAGGYLRGRRKSFLEVWTRIFAALAIAGMALALRGTEGNMSVPLAALCGQAICATILCLFVLNDARKVARDKSPEGLDA